MNNSPEAKNALLVNGYKEIMALADFWPELDKLGWKFRALCPGAQKKILSNGLGWPIGRFYPLPRANSKLKAILALILWPLWFIFYLTIFTFYKYRKKINFIICFDLPELLILAPISKILRLPAVTLLDPQSIRQFEDLKIRRFMLVAAKKPRLLVMCEESKKQLIELGFLENNISLIGPGIRTKNWQHQADIFSTLAAADKKRSNKKFFSLGTVVELNSQQNIETLFQAAKKCLTVIPHLQIVIIGDGPERKNLAWLAKKINIGNLVWFVGEQKHLKKWLENIDVYITTCALAGIGDMMNTLYAAASALPIISQKNIGLNDIITDNKNGRMTGGEDNEALAQAIISFYKDKRSQKEHGQTARETVRQKYLLEHMLNNFLASVNE